MQKGKPLDVWHTDMRSFKKLDSRISLNLCEMFGILFLEQLNDREKTFTHFTSTKNVKRHTHCIEYLFPLPQPTM